MKFIDTSFEGLLICEPTVFKDDRGHFFESYNKSVFEEGIGHSVDFVQDNQSFSHKGVLRGLHYQKGSAAQAKLVRVVAGEVLDIVVDIRPDSPTFGRHISTQLSAKQSNMIYIPKGMAHGFLALEDNTVFVYKCDNFYNKEAERGILYNDPALAIAWGISEESLNISDKDLNLPLLKDIDL